MSSESYRYRVGADENGLGPRLGPLVVTAVLAECDARGHALASKPTRGAMQRRLGDSKALVAHGDVALGEAWARALAERDGGPPQSVDELVQRLSLDAQGELERPCPSPVARAQCWSAHGEAFVASDALVGEVKRDLDALDRGGLRLLRSRSVVVCNQRLNAASRAGISRFSVDLHAMERLALAHREAAGDELLAVCGKVGALRQYERAFGPLAGRLTSPLEERKERSAYRVAGLGELAFVMDSDASDRLVAIASLVGKYLREVLMGRIVRHYRDADPSLPDVSGYHDPVTARFVEATAPRRLALAIPDACFERAKSGR